MKDIKYICMKCGLCCHEVLWCPGSKRIPLYPDEVDKLIEIAKERKKQNKKGGNFKVIEDLVFPDVLNRKLLVVTYKIRLDNAEACCPFYDPIKSCTVHELKPLACQAYPLSLKRVDAFNFEISIDSLCNFVNQNYEKLKTANLEKIKQIFKDEYPKGLNHLKKNQNIMLKIKKLEYEKKIKISRHISLKDFNKYLKEWEREELIV